MSFNDSKEKIRHQKAVSDKVLYMVSVLDDTALVAGGAPRDWYLGLPASDLDVYVCIPYTSTLTVGTVIDSLKLQGFEDIQEVGDSRINSFDKNNMIASESKPSPEYCYDPYILMVLQTVFEGEVVQFIISTRDHQETIKDFYTSLSMAWYKDATIFTTKLFEMSIKNKVIVVTGTQFLGNKYHEKIKSKFSDYQWCWSKEDFVDKYLLN